MSRKNLFLLIVTCLFLSSSSVIAEEGGYFSAFIGPSFLKNATFYDPGVPVTVDTEFKTGLTVGIALGYNLGTFRLEGEAGYRTHSIDKFEGDIKTLSYLVNGFYDINTTTAFTPYIGGGAGIAKIDVKDVSMDGVSVDKADDTVLAYQLGAGIGYAIGKKLTLDIGYRYFATSNPEFEGTDSKYRSQNITAGIRFAFQ